MGKTKRNQPNNHLKEERVRRGWSQSAVGEKIGSDPKTVGRWERGETIPGIHLRKQLCDLFQLEPEELGFASKGGKESQGQITSEEAVVSSSPIIPETLEYVHEVQSSASCLEEHAHASLSDLLQQMSPSNEKLSPGSHQEEEDTAVPALPLPPNKNRRRMIERVYALWITGLLNQSLHGAVLLAMGLHEHPAAVTEPWRLALQEMERPTQDLPPGTRITHVYDMANGELLLLGEPGSGKTTLLLELARNLLQRARENPAHPIPVVFNLSSWALRRQSLADWLVEELNEKYQVPHSLGKEWIETDSVLPLLDGLDEVDLAHRTDCVNAINNYRKSHGLLAMVVCSRSAEYLALRSQLLLRSAVVLQPLTMEQADEYLSSLGEQVEGVRLALQEDKELQELATTPLLLSILTLAYQGKSSTDLLTLSSPINRRQAVFEYYVRQMLLRRGSSSRFSSKQTEYWLAWMAKQLVERKQTEFYIEQMQFDWLPERWIHRFLPVLSIGLVYGLFIGLVFVIFNALFFEFRISLFIGTMLGLFNAFLYCVFNGLARRLFYKQHSSITEIKGLFPLEEMMDMITPIVENRLTYGLLFVVFNGLFYGLLSGMVNYGRFSGTISELDMSLLYRLSYGLLYGLFIGIGLGILGKLNWEIHPAETLFWSLRSFQKNAVKFLLIGGGLGFLYSLVYPPSVKIAFVLLSGIGGLFLGGISNKALDSRQRLKPNQGIWRSVRNSAITGITGGLLTWLVIGGAFGIFYGPFIGLSYGFIPALAVGGCVALRQGGTASILHGVLRFLLWRNGYVPWNYPRFLNFASERVLLRKIGGGYIFVHRLVLEYFASLPTYF